MRKLANQIETRTEALFFIFYKIIENNLIKNENTVSDALVYKISILLMNLICLIKGTDQLVK